MANVRIIKHEAVTKCGSFDDDGRPSTYFYWDDLPSRRLRPDLVTGDVALEQAKTLARAERDPLSAHCCPGRALARRVKKMPRGRYHFDALSHAAWLQAIPDAGAGAGKQVHQRDKSHYNSDTDDELALRLRSHFSFAISLIIDQHRLNPASSALTSNGA
jgi:hypothetical protein